MKIVLTIVALGFVLSGCGNVPNQTLNGNHDSVSQAQAQRGMAEARKAIKAHFERRNEDYEVAIESLELSPTPLGHTYTFKAAKMAINKQPFRSIRTLVEGIYQATTKKIIVISEKAAPDVVYQEK